MSRRGRHRDRGSGYRFFVTLITESSWRHGPRPFFLSADEYPDQEQPLSSNFRGRPLGTAACSATLFVKVRSPAPFPAIRNEASLEEHYNELHDVAHVSSHPSSSTYRLPSFLLDRLSRARLLSLFDTTFDRAF